MKHLTRILIVLLLASWLGAAHAATVEADICIYGGTSGGVVSAVQAARMGKRVILVEPGNHLGGMMSGGFSWSDVGSADRAKLFGGLAREVFERIGKHYGQDPKTVFDVTAPEVAGRAKSGVDFIRPPSLAFEPKVAEQVFTELAREAGVVVRFGARLKSVVKQGARLTQLTLENGSTVKAQMFVDATYEGDLMAASGVSYTLGREANDQYGEKGNGVRGPLHGPASGRFIAPVDPYVRAGDPGSGLLPLIAGDSPAPLGSADKHIQSYNYRLCLTDDPALRVPLDPPAGYDPAHWELLGRYIVALTGMGEKLTLRSFCKYDPLPNHKFDFNNRWPISTDMLGSADGWPEGSAAEREKIARAHQDYLRGFFHFLRTDPRVPETVREEASRFGLPRDEFPDNGHWPHQLYVREARRMVSDIVMTEHHIRNERIAPNPVALATYPMDIHAVRRVFQGGKLYNEGFGEGGGKPAPIGYGAIVPKSSECENLFVTFALSSSHAAFGSIRMEPVFMVTSQSAATAAVLAIDDGVPVQAVDYAKLKKRLLADGQIIEVPVGRSETSDAKPVTTPPPMLLKSAAKPADVNGKSYDLVVVGATPGGIACAVRAAREGLSVLLVNHTRHLGGFVTSGAGGWEAPYDGLRSPLFGEMITGAAAYYRDKYGEGSPQHLASMPSKTSRAHLDRPKIEPRIAELLFNQMVEQEKSLTVLLGHVVANVVRDGSVLKSVTLQPMHGQGTVTVSGKIFADAMYEGDLMAAAGVKTQIGRESRQQYNEPHAGVIYTRERTKEPGQRGFPQAADKGTLNIRYNPHSSGEIVEGPHSGEADSSVMAYNYRLILTRDPANRIMVSKPANYDPAIAKAPAGASFVPNLPNNKVAWNGGRLIGPQNEYPGADWPRREAISKQYLDSMLMVLWRIQNDPEAPAREREQFAGYGLAADEFPDNQHVPYEIYVREARRLVGRYVFKEQDNVIAEGIARTPVHSDSIAMTDWPLDSVACLPRTTPGGSADGIFFLGEETRPAQVPYRSILANEIENLLVPVAISASHVGWGSIRLEPVWMQLGESAGHAAALAVKRQTTPAKLDPDLLIRKLANSRVMITFFNDLDVASDDPRVPATQYFGTKGFFADYNARMNEPLTEAVRSVWLDGFKELQQGTLDAAKLAVAVHAAEAKESPSTGELRADALLRLWKHLNGQTPVIAKPTSSIEQKPLRILPLGDSITRGSYLTKNDGKSTGLPHPDGGGWRKPLQAKLRAAGIAFDFVGELSYAAFGHDGVIDPTFDSDHHGLAGFGNTGILKGGVVPTLPDVLASLGVKEIKVPGIVDVLKKHQPDIILLMSGANGFDAPARDQLIRTIGETSPAHLFVATILPQKAPRAGREKVDAYNASLPAIVAAQKAAGKRITFVDMHAAITTDDLWPDGVHPNQAGMDRMAAT